MHELTDTHAHFDGLGKGEPAAVDAALQRAAEAGVRRVIAVGGHPDGNRLALEIAARHPGTVQAAAGYDRYGATRDDLDHALLERQLESPAVVAVGETGLDFHYEPRTADRQIALFQTMLALARARRLPIVAHVREAEAAMAPLLEQHAAHWPGDPLRIGVIHCFTGSAAFAERALACGFFISFSGILSFPRAENVRAAARVVPLDRLLAETDTPYLAPVPLRGKPNEPAFLPHVVAELARVKDVPPETMAAATHANAGRLFGSGL